MKRFMFVCFLFLGWGFYELSGGSEFEPERREVAEASPATEPQVDTASELALVTPDQPGTNGSSIQDRLATALVTPAVTEVLLETTGPVIDLTETTPEVVEAVVEITEIAEPQPEPVIQPLDLRLVAGSRVNMRSGPSTEYTVLVTLDSGTTTEVLDSNDDGWVRVRVRDSGLEGWMAERLLEPVNG